MKNTTGWVRRRRLPRQSAPFTLAKRSRPEYRARDIAAVFPDQVLPPSFPPSVLHAACVHGIFFYRIPDDCSRLSGRRDYRPPTATRIHDKSNLKKFLRDNIAGTNTSPLLRRRVFPRESTLLVISRQPRFFPWAGRKSDAKRHVGLRLSTSRRTHNQSGPMTIAVDPQKVHTRALASKARHAHLLLFLRLSFFCHSCFHLEKIHRANCSLTQPIRLTRQNGTKATSGCVMGIIFFLLRDTQANRGAQADPFDYVCTHRRLSVGYHDAPRAPHRYDGPFLVLEKASLRTTRL